MDRASKSTTDPLLLLAGRRLEGTNTMTIDSLRATASNGDVDAADLNGKLYVFE